MQAVLFDLDGTLLAPGGGIRKSIDHALTSHGLPAFGAEEILVGLPLREILQIRSQDPAQIESMVLAFREFFLEEAWRFASWYPGMRELLVAVCDAGYPMAVVTTKGEDEARSLLTRLGVAHLFAAIVGDDDTRPLKPDPAPVLEACQRLGIEPRQAIMVGDTRFDVEAGKAAGAATVGVAWGHGGSEHGPHAADHIVEAPEHLLPLLQALLQMA